MDAFLAYIFRTQWLVLFIVGGLLLLVSEIGYRMGVRLFRKQDEARRGQIGGIQGAVLGMLGLLLGFTFAMAVARYEVSRELVLAEANSIGTTYLRASFLPPPHQTAVEELLRRYVDLRLDFYHAGTDKDAVDKAEQGAAQIHRELWKHAVAAAKESPSPITATFINSLNETIDLDASRLNAMRTRVPEAVWLLLLLVASVGCHASGYGAGASGVRNMFSGLILPLLITVLITILADLNRPRQGLIGISQQPMSDLQQSLRAP